MTHMTTTITDRHAIKHTLWWNRGRHRHIKQQNTAKLENKQSDKHKHVSKKAELFKTQKGQLFDRNSKQITV